MKKLFTAILISSIISADLPDGPYGDCINDAKEEYSACRSSCYSTFNASLCMDQLDSLDPRLIDCLNEVMTSKLECLNICYDIYIQMRHACLTFA